VIGSDGKLTRRLRYETLGPKSEIGTKREALKILANRLQPLNEGWNRPQSTITFAAFVEEHFLPKKLGRFKFSTQQSYSSLLRKHFLPYFGGRRLDRIGTEDVEDYLRAKELSGYAWETRKRIRDLLSKIMSTAVRWGYLSSNSVRGIELGEREVKRQRVILSASQVGILLRVCDEPLKTIVLLAVMGGLRIGEILALRWRHVDVATGIVSIKEACYRRHFGTPKTKASRRIAAVGPTTTESLRAYMELHPAPHPDCLLFTHPDGRLFNYDVLLDKLKRACKAADVPIATFHDLRHTHQTLSHSTGTPLRVSQAQLGHSSIAMTLDVYTHAMPEQQQEAALRMDRLLFTTVHKKGGETQVIQ
jgi:integrase